jgi:carbon-monoxide dehydrogenase medium subunit/6-hydroxypseudooxynicotine dehydrogenase subunit alpha
VKPAAFAYHAPGTIDQTLALLEDGGDDAKVLAGGQSLVPLLNFRLARPSTIVDINRVAALSYVRRQGGRLQIGSMTRTAVLERSTLVAGGWPVLRDAARYVGHAAIRNRGTVGGSAAHADPTAELPVVLTALGATLQVRSRSASRTIGADEFFLGRLTTALQPDELLVGIEIGPLPPNTTHGFAEFARIAGDFALAGACVLLTRDANGRCTAASIVLLGADTVPWRARAAERALVGAVVDAATANEIADVATADTKPPEPVRYRRALLAEMTRTALMRAASKDAAR